MMRPLPLARRLTCLLMLAALSAAAHAQPATPPGAHVTDHLENLGIPLQPRYPDGDRIYARNPWDMIGFEGKLYIGSGNSANAGPARNPWPVVVLTYDPRHKTFDDSFVVDDDQIDVFHVFDGRLYIPGHDPKENWRLGNFYRLEDGRWTKHRNIPNGIHNYFMARHDGKLFAALGTRKGAQIATSSDDGQSWTTQLAGFYRMHAFVTVAGELYATGIFHPDASRQRLMPDAHPAVVWQYAGEAGFEPRGDLTGATMMPEMEVSERSWMKLVQPQPLGEHAAYIAGRLHNDHQFVPMAVYLARSLKPGAVDVQQLDLPEGLRPWDLLASDGRLYVLATGVGEQDYLIHVLAYDAQTQALQPQFHFHAPTFARSLARLDGDFYFGLGCEIRRQEAWRQANLHPATGTLLRLPREHVPQPAAEH